MNTAYVVEWALNGVRSMEAFPEHEMARRFCTLVAGMNPTIHVLSVRTNTFLDAMGVPRALPGKRCKPCNDTGATHCADPANCGGPWDDRAQCLCPEGMCASKPHGCRMAAELNKPGKQ